MSKVYEALQHAYADRHEVSKTLPVERPRSQPIVLSTLPPVKFDREMSQLHQRLTSLLPDPQHAIIQFLSCQGQEGVSIIAQEFARVCVEKHGKSILLVDGDSENMTQHHSLGITPKTSLQQVMKNGGDLDQVITPVVHSRLFLAQLSENGTHTPQHDSTISKGDLWVHIRKQFDLIVIDTPPLGTSDEGLELCPVVDGVVMVVEAEKTRSHVVSNLKERIVHNGGKLLGVVFNKQQHYIPKWFYSKL